MITGENPLELMGQYAALDTDEFRKVACDKEPFLIKLLHGEMQERFNIDELIHFLENPNDDLFHEPKLGYRVLSGDVDVMITADGRDINHTMIENPYKRLLYRLGALILGRCSSL